MRESTQVPAPRGTSPVPRRLKHAKWWDIRIIGGVLLLGLSVFLGSVLINANTRTDGVLAATRNMAAGTVLTSADVEIVQVNLGAVNQRYLAEGAAVVGQTLVRPVRTGELIPIAALEAAPPARRLALAVPPEGMPPGIERGSLVDIYLTTSHAERSNTKLISGSVPVQTVLAPASGGLAGAVNQHFQVSIHVDPAQAARIVGLLPTGTIRLVLVTGG